MGKRTIAVCILHVLRKNTGYRGNELKTLSVNEIKKELEKSFSLKVERNTVFDNLMDLIELQEKGGTDYTIGVQEGRSRHTRGGYEQTDKRYYIDRDDTNDDRLTDAELIFLACHVKGNKNLDDDVACNILKKLERLSTGTPLEVSGSVFCQAGNYEAANGDFLDQLVTIRDAIRKGKQIVFETYKYTAGDKPQLHLDKENCQFNPHKIVVSHGQYYLLGIRLGETALSHYRIDRIMNVVMLDQSVECFAGGWDIDAYLNEHPYMNEGGKTEITLCVREEAIGELVDEFGEKSIDQSRKETDQNASWDDYWRIRFSANKEDVARFVMMHADAVEVLGPQSLRDRMRKIARDMRWDYIKTEEDRYQTALEEIKFHNRLALVDIDLSTRTLHQNISSSYRPKQLLLCGNALKDISFLADNKAYHSMYTLYIMENEELSDFSPIEKLQELRDLMIINTNLEDISFILKLTKLERLVLFGEFTEDYSVLFQMKNLKRLTIGSEAAECIDLKSLKAQLPELQLNIEEEDFFQRRVNMARFEGEIAQPKIREATEDKGKNYSLKHRSENRRYHKRNH